MKLVCTIFMMMIFVSVMTAQDQQSTKVYGNIMGDYAYKSNGDTLTTANTTQYSKSLPVDGSAFLIRRIYLFIDHTFSKDFTGLILFQADDKTLTSENKIGFFTKVAYLEWRNIIDHGDLRMGLVWTPTWMNVEGLWGYRSIEKTITDMRNFGAGADFGVSLQGTLALPTTLSYMVMVGNGNGQKLENNNSKKFYFLLGTSPIQNLSIEVSVDHEPAAYSSKTLVRGFAAYTTPQYMLGVEAVQQTLAYAGVNGADEIPSGVSIYSWQQLATRWKSFIRADYFDNDHNTSDGFAEYFLSAGLDFSVIPDVHLMPNVWADFYSDKSSLHRTKDADIVWRLSFYCNFK
jgi:hypothetical protein